jgi:hypothetical protein
VRAIGCLVLASLLGCGSRPAAAPTPPEGDSAAPRPTTLAEGLERPRLRGQPFSVHALPAAIPSRRTAASINGESAFAGPSIGAPSSIAKHARGISVRALFEHEPFGNAEFGPRFGFATPGGQIPLHDPFLSCSGGGERDEEGSWTGLASSRGRLSVTLVSGGFNAGRCEVSVRGVEHVAVEPLVPEVALYAFRTSNLADLVLIFPRSDRVTTDGQAWMGSFTEVRIPLVSGGSMMTEIWRGAVGGFERVLDLPRSPPLARAAASVSVEVVLDRDALPHGTLYTDLDP